MKLIAITCLAAIASCITCCCTMLYAASAEKIPASASVKDLAAAAKTAKVEFRPLSQEDVARAKIRLLDAVERLDERLGLDGSNGRDWAKYLELSVLREQLRGPSAPDNAVLTRILGRHNSGYEGLELVWFLDVQRSLHNYLATSAAVDNPAIRQGFQDRLDYLAANLESYAAKPTTEGALLIGESIRWLQDAQQVPDLVAAIQRQFVQPNLIAEISPQLVGAGIARVVDDTSPVRDCILGTDIHATAHTQGQTSTVLAPDPDFGVLDTLFTGTTQSVSVGYNGPVTIYSNATTDLSARKRMWIDSRGLWSYPSESIATTSVDINDIQSNKGRRMVEQIAWKRAGRQHDESECIASRHAEVRLNQRIDQESAESLEQANRDYEKKFYRPLNDRKLFPQQFQFSTTERGITLVGLQAGGGKVAAPGAAPEAVETADLSLRIHESTINNLAFDALAGRTVYEEKVQEAAISALGKLPEKMKGDDDGKPWAITFASRQPISVTFADGGFKVTLRGARYVKGRDIYPAMDVSASYKIEKTTDGFKTVRQGDIQVFPPDYRPGKQIDARRQTIRTLLEKRFGKVFEPEFVGTGLEMGGRWKSAGKLQPIQFEARDGWLIIAWKLPAKEPHDVTAK